ncbi:hypothetical protein TYRP_010411 [Tyrophagus putrescentiae]|nr:hypothetical protein TYRP_010411 [Tyrophagus putrescentiae]
MPSAFCGVALLVPCALHLLFLVTFAGCSLLLNIVAVQGPESTILKFTTILLLAPVAALFAAYHLLAFFGLVPVGRRTEVALFGGHILLAVATIVGVVYPRFLFLASLRRPDRSRRR